MSEKEITQDKKDRPTRKGMHRYFHVSRFDWYLSSIIAFVFAIFGMISRVYYKLLEEQYDKK
jgi:hypothetical protein